MDLGASWTEIGHQNKSPFMSTVLGVTILPNTGETVLPQGAVAADRNTFYKGSCSVFIAQPMAVTLGIRLWMDHGNENTGSRRNQQ